MTTTTRLTLEEFLELPDTKPAREYACGEVFQKPMPGQTHSLIQIYLAFRLFAFNQSARLGRVGTEWRCVFGPKGRRRAFVPDLMFVAASRLTGDETFRGPPDLAIEILSPDQDTARFAAKVQFYLRHGVRTVWVIDPARRIAVIFRPGEDERELTEVDTLDGEDVLPGFRLPLAELFAQLDPLT